MQKIITENIGDKVILLLQGDVDTCDQRLTRRLQSVRAKDKEVLIWVDCGSIESIRQLGVCHFINQLLVLRNQDTQVVLVQPDPQVRQALALFKMDSFFTYITSLEQAYAGV